MPIFKDKDGRTYFAKKEVKSEEEVIVKEEVAPEQKPIFSGKTGKVSKKGKK